jgi:prophage antirepressor-like protein
MSKLTLTTIPFSFEDNRLRVVMRESEPWFVASDVCEALEIGNASLAVNGRADRDGKDGLDEDEKGIDSVNAPFGNQEMLIVNESGLYGLIFKSRKPEAKRFKKWVTNEVLPSIRKTGSYNILPTNYIAALEDLLASKKAEALALGERDHAIRTKHLIGNKREATAMATASVAVREVKRLRDELGFSARHATILQVGVAA